jgi:hypothetical protein
MKLDSILENQKEILVYLRRQSSGMGRTCVVVLEDVLPKPMDSVEEVEDFCGKLNQVAFKKSLASLNAG